MQNKQHLAEEMEMVNTLRVITQSYQEISVIRMQRIRGSVLSTRDFLSNLGDVFYDVKTAYKKQIEKIMKSHVKEGITSFSTLNRNGKTVSVFLSPNTRLQGEIVFRVFLKFFADVKKDPTDIMVIGKFGKDMYEQQPEKPQYMYFEIPEANVTIEDLKPVVFNLLNYEKVNVYYGKFENILNQTPTVTNVTGDQDMDKKKKNENNTDDEGFIFEPSLDKILNFFEVQIFTTLFKQTIYESQLSQFASRITAMETALQNIESNSGKLLQEKRKIHRAESDRKQIGSLSGISLWTK